MTLELEMEYNSQLCEANLSETQSIGVLGVSKVQLQTELRMMNQLFSSIAPHRFAAFLQALTECGKRIRLTQKTTFLFSHTNCTRDGLTQYLKSKNRII